MRLFFLSLILALCLTPVFSASPVTFPRDTIRISQNLADIKMRDLQKIANRKFSFREKLVIRTAQKMERKNYRLLSGRTDGELSFLAAVSLLVVFGVLQLLINDAAVIGWAGPTALVLILLLAAAALWLGLRSKKKIGGNFKNWFGIIVGGGVLVLAVVALVSEIF